MKATDELEDIELEIASPCTACRDPTHPPSHRWPEWCVCCGGSGRSRTCLEPEFRLRYPYVNKNKPAPYLWEEYRKQWETR